jgi:hypothetical protein
LANEIVSSSPFIAGRGEFFCRGCLGKNLFSGLDLGDLPIANELLLSSESEIEKFPLHLRICTDCGLGQVADVVTPERIFRDYRYLSSVSTTFLKHASDFVTQQIESNAFLPNDWVLEIASNDGYLLKNFLPYEIRIVGVEPAENVAELSRGLGIETISEFFSCQLAIELLKQYGFPKLIIANNVLAHVPDLIDIFKGLAALCGPDTKISIENPSLSNILMGMQFDTIYHEHYSYLSAFSVSRLGKMHGLSLFKVEELKIHGGSNRYWLEKLTLNSAVESSVEKVTNLEIESGLFQAKVWTGFSSRVSRILDNFLQWLTNAQKDNRRLYGYGAAAKASTILNSIEVPQDSIRAIADLSQEKQGRLMPPHGVPIISPQELFSEKPTDVIIFPWNIKSEIASFLRLNLGDQVRLWCAIPDMHQIEEK